MANWCNNVVVFEGNTHSLNEIQQLFNTMSEKAEQDSCGQLPEFIDDTHRGHFFYISQMDDFIGIIEYLTKWIPNTEILKVIAERYDVDFVHDYEELGCGICGKATFYNNILTDIFLDDEDFEQYEFDRNRYLFF